MSNRDSKHDELDEVAAKIFQTNATGNIHLFNLFLPLVLKGKVKKVIAISSGHGDLDFINQMEIEQSALYSAPKAALNVIVAKFSAQYKKDGVLFVSISPGMVDVGHFADGTYQPVSSVRYRSTLLTQTHSHPRAVAGLDGGHG